MCPSVFDSTGFTLLIYGYLRRLPKAVQAYEKVLESDPRHAVALSFLAICYHLMGDLDSAILKYHEVGCRCGVGSSHSDEPPRRP